MNKTNTTTTSRRAFLKTGMLLTATFPLLRAPALFGDTPAAPAPPATALPGCCGSRLRLESLTNPVGIGHTAPRFSWEIPSTERGIKQTAYRILVASTQEKLSANVGDVWDSGNIPSDETVSIAYAGQKLKNSTTYFWKVRTRTNDGKSVWSLPASWTMALVNGAPWKAKWIGLDKSFPGDVLRGRTRLPARYLRKEFSAAKKPAKATLYISGLGLYKLYINGKKIGNFELSPTPTDYNKTVKYNTFDITDELSEGTNAVGVALGNGRYFSVRSKGYGFPCLVFQLEIEYADGDKQIIASDNTWKLTVNGPIRANNEFDGEEYDARMEIPGWNTVGFDDSQWLQTEFIKPPVGKLEAQLNKNIKIMETLKPVSIKENKPGVFILDMGQNMVGWVSMDVKGKAGDKVKLKFAESIKDDGSLYMANLRGALVTDYYTLKGGGKETFEPTFTYHGFRFVEITGYPGTPTINDFTGKVIYDEIETTGSFETSNATLNQIYKNAIWGIKGNYRGMPTDCPQRDERQGWLGDRAVGSHGESFMFDINNLYAKWLDDIEEAQRGAGSVPDVAPKYWNIHSDNMTWPATYVIIADMLYKQFGNKEPIVKHYPSMKKWITYMRKKYKKDGIMPRDKYGDWCMPPEAPDLIHSKDPARKTDGNVLGTTFYYRMLTLLERFAALQGKTDDARAFAQEAAQVKKAYNKKFFNPETAQYSNGTVTANVLSLSYGLVPAEEEKRVFDNIIQKTEGEFKKHISVGLVGAQWLMRGLSDYGRADLAYTIATNRDYPSWGYMIENGATTIWELWNGNTANPAMNSHNHVMLLGDLIVWFYEYLAGIKNAPESVGFKKIEMKPHPVAGLDHVTASYRSVRGKIKSAWKKQDGKFVWDISLPANTSATIYIPAKGKESVTESGSDVALAKGVTFIKEDGAVVVFEIQSGTYHFSAK